MTRKTIDCRTTPNEVGCTLAISGEQEEVLNTATRHAVDVHGHAGGEELRSQLQSLLVDEPVPSSKGSFVQLIEFESKDISDYGGIVSRWASAIGPERTARWSLVCADRDRPGRYVAIVEFPDYESAMRNSANPATSGFVKELQEITSGEPRYRNLDVHTAEPL